MKRTSFFCKQSNIAKLMNTSLMSPFASACDVLRLYGKFNLDFLIMVVSYRHLALGLMNLFYNSDLFMKKL